MWARPSSRRFDTRLPARRFTSPRRATGRATVVVQPPSLPLPSAAEDPRRDALAAVLDALSAAGIPRDRQTVLVAGGLGRRVGRRELERLMRPDRARGFRGRVVVHDCEDENLVRLELDGRPHHIHPRARRDGRRRHRRRRRDRSERRGHGPGRRVRAFDDPRRNCDVAARAVGRPGLAARRRARSRAAAPGAGRRVVARPRPAAPHGAVPRLPVGPEGSRVGHSLPAAARRQRGARSPAALARRATHVRAAHRRGARRPAVGRARRSAAPRLSRPRRTARAAARRDRRAAPAHRARDPARAPQPDHRGRARARPRASPVARPAAAARGRHRRPAPPVHPRDGARAAGALSHALRGPSRRLASAAPRDRGRRGTRPARRRRLPSRDRPASRGSRSPTGTRAAPCSTAPAP